MKNSEEEKKEKTTTRKNNTNTKKNNTSTKKTNAKKANATKVEKEEIKVKEEAEVKEEKEEIIVTKEEKKVKNEKEKATFLQRFVAYIIDIFLVSFIASLLVFPFIDNDNAEKLSNESMEVIEKYTNSEIDMKTYAAEMSSLTYQSAKSNGIVALVTLVCEILYFAVFQLYNNGQTLGKKLLKIKVVAEDGKLSMNQMVVRALIVNSILLEIISFCFMLFAGETVYFYGVATLEMIQYAVLVISAFMIMWSAKRQGIHDKIVHTEVVNL